MSTIKFCTKCGHKFTAVGREVICPSCREAAREEAKKAAVLKAKRASWSGESVPVRISGRASTLIRKYGAAHDVPFAHALDALLQSTSFFADLGTEWDTIQPYKSRRMKKSADGEQEVKQDKPLEVPASPSKPVVQATKVADKASTKKTASKAVKTVKKGVKA